MPSLITHHIFALEVYKKISKNNPIKLTDNLQTYLAFAQSHDYLFHFYSLNFKKAKKIRDLGHKAHKQKTQAYLINIIQTIKKYHLENYEPAIAYLYGSITHYVLDTTCHPFIFYKTGVYNKNKKETLKYKGQHTHIEKDIDAYYYKKYFKKEYKTCNVPKDIIKNPKFPIELLTLINIAYNNTYNEKNIGLYYKQSIKKAKLFYRIIINDRLGIKRTIYKLLDNIFNHHMSYLSSYSTHITNPNIEYLNLEHKEWFHPCNKKDKYNYSFDDLIDISLKKTLKIIEIVNMVLYENKDISILENIIPNLSYSTGLPLDENRTMKFFEY